MFDTSEIKHFSLPITEFGLKEYRWEQKKYGKFPTLILNSDSENLPNLTAIKTPDGWQLIASGSFPKTIFGHNARLPNQDEVKDGLQIYSEYIEANSGLSFDAENAIVARIDYAKDLQESEEKVLFLVNKLAKKVLPNKDKLFYNDTTLYFNSKDKSMANSVRIYPKLQQVLSKTNPSREEIEQATGILRFERILKKHHIQLLVKRLGLPDKTAKTLFNQEISDLVMAETLEMLSYDEIEITTDSTLVFLLKHFKTKQAMNLFSFIEMIKIYGLNFFKKPFLDYSRTTYLDNVRKLKTAKLWHLVGVKE